MSDILGQVILWGARLLGLFLLYLLVQHFKPTLFYRGWSSLWAEYGRHAVLPPQLALHHTSLRVGTEHYNQTAYIGLDGAGVYLRRPGGNESHNLLCIPYGRLKLVAAPRRAGALHLPVYGIFRVSGVEVWIDSPYAEQIMDQLPTP